MSICKVSITRPVFTWVIVIVLCLFGLIALNRMPIREYPDIEMPIVTVSTTYTGASAAVVESRITRQIENALAGVEGLSSISSISRDGNSRITLEFNISRDIDGAANDVRDQVSKVHNRLPDEADLPRISKYDSNNSPVIIVALYGAGKNQMELTDYADRFLTNRFAVVDGVAAVNIFGGQEQAMRIWLDRKAMVARGITSGDVSAALERENVEYPGGRIESLEREFTVRVQRNYLTEEDFRNLIIRRDDSGDFVRIRDIAKVAIASKAQRSFFASNGEPMVSMGIYKQSKANTLSVSSGVKELMEGIRPSLPAGVEMRVLRDDAKFIEQSIKEVEETLLISGILVFIIIFIFLGSMRASIIPAITIPVALLSAFIVMFVVGFSINILTLLALVLAIGMVVDDAIVMVENIHRHIEKGETPLLAAARGADQVIFAVLATTVVLAAVFLPISLWEGQTGKLFTEFSVAMTSAVCFSSLVALTLTPMLCSKFLKRSGESGKIAQLIDLIMSKTEYAYEKLIRKIAKYKILTMSIFCAGCIAVIYGWQNLPSEYEPQEDRGSVNVRILAPEGTNFYSMVDYADEVYDRLKIHMLNGGKVDNIMLYVPGFGGSEGAVNNATAMIELSDWSVRDEHSKDMMKSFRDDLNAISGVKSLPYLPQGISRRSANAVVVSLGGPDYETLTRWRDILLERLADYPGLVDADFDYKETMPRLSVEINRERAGELGVSAKSIGETLQTMLGSQNFTTFEDRGQEYDVILQADRASRFTPTDLNNIFVRSQTTGKLIPLDNIVKIVEKGEAGRRYRYNRVLSITLTGNVASGYSLSEVLDHIERLIREEMPDAQISYSGQSKDMKESSGSMIFVFVLALFVSYLVLAAQFESFISPVVVILTVPLGMMGAIGALSLMGLTMNIYTQIGLIMLIGLAAKNGILIVEFANQLRDEGLEFTEALFAAARMRLRPILMTGISTVAGAIPLLFASGAGAASRNCLGAVVVFGGTSACLLTMLIVPIGYLIFAKNEKSPKTIAKKLEVLEKEHAKII